MFSSDELLQFEQTLKRERKILQQEIMFFLTHSNLGSHKTLCEQLTSSPKRNWVERLLPNCCDELQPIVENLDKVEASLSQIELGLFGLCADCEAEIPRETLFRNPSHQRCQKCYQKHIDQQIPD